MRARYLRVVYHLARCILAGRVVKPVSLAERPLMRLGLEEVRLTKELAHANEGAREKAWRFLCRHCRPEEVDNVDYARIIGWIRN